MLPDDHPAVVNELERRAAERARADAKANAGKATENEGPEVKGKKARAKNKKSTTAATEGDEGGDGMDSASGWETRHQHLAESRFSTLNFKFLKL